MHYLPIGVFVKRDFWVTSPKTSKWLEMTTNLCSEKFISLRRQHKTQHFLHRWKEHKIPFPMILGYKLSFWMETNYHNFKKSICRKNKHRPLFNGFLRKENQMIYQLFLDCLLRLIIRYQDMVFLSQTTNLSSFYGKNWTFWENVAFSPVLTS